MKKIVLILISILVGLYIILSILGSGGEYAAERLFYNIAVSGDKIAANPDVAPPKMIDEIEIKMKKLLAKYPATETAKTANIKLVEFYITYKKYDQAIVQADKIIKKYDKNPGILSMAYFLKGVAYEKQDRWSDAPKEYHIVRDNYTNTRLAMEVPLYIAGYYSRSGKESQEREAYNEAARFYENVEKENRKQALGYMSSLFLVQTYIKIGDFESAGRVVEETLNRYFSPMAVMQLLPMVENIIVTKLKNPDKAAEIYKTILAKSKDAKFNKVLQKRISELTTKK